MEVEVAYLEKQETELLIRSINAQITKPKFQSKSNKKIAIKSVRVKGKKRVISFQWVKAPIP